jgi:hypothetical protein
VWVIVAVGAVFAALTALAVAAFLPDTWRESLKAPLRRLRVEVPGSAGPLPLALRPREQLATIITTCGKLIASQVLKELGRGVTALQGTGMYTGETRDVLLCAMTEVQAPHLRKIVYDVDPDAFVIISSAEEVRGGGFQPFEPPS